MRVDAPQGMPRAERKSRRQPIARHQACAAASRIACQPLRAGTPECAAKILARLGPSSRGIGGQQQAGFQKGQPGGHHQIIRRQFQPQSALALLNKRKVLACQGQDRISGADQPSACATGSTAGPKALHKPSTSTISASAARRSFTSLWKVSRSDIGPL